MKRPYGRPPHSLTKNEGKQDQVDPSKATLCSKGRCCGICARKTRRQGYPWNPFSLSNNNNIQCSVWAVFVLKLEVQNADNMMMFGLVL